jgi:hypothetical protein
LVTTERKKMCLGTAQLPGMQNRMSNLAVGRASKRLSTSESALGRALRTSAGAKTAGKWLQAFPIVKAIRLNNAAFVDACRSHLRLPLTALAGVQHCQCGRAMDKYGHNAAKCLCGGSTRHHNLRNELYSIAKELRLAAKVEDKSHLAPTSHDSGLCLDLALYNVPASGQHMLIDVSYVATTAQPGVERDASGDAAACTPEAFAASCPENTKQNTYSGAIIGGHRLYPFEVEASSGALGSDAVKVLQTLARVMQRERNMPYGCCVKALYDRVSCNVQRELHCQ